MNDSKNKTDTRHTKREGCDGERIELNNAARVPCSQWDWAIHDRYKERRTELE
jgi:hypothetical protein